MQIEITESTARELIEALDNNAEALKENTIAFNAMQHQVGGRQ